MVDDNTVVIDLIRHGKVDGPAALYGRTDVLLNEQGWEQLSTTFGRLPKADLLVSSPLKRCVNFARYWSQTQEVALSISHHWQECHFGDWDGVPFDDLAHIWKELEAFWQAPDNVTPPNGEALHQVHERVCAAWRTLLSEATTPPSSTSKQNPHRYIQVLTHGGVIRQVLAYVLQLDWAASALYQQLTLDYATVTRFQLSQFPGAKPRVLFIGSPV